MQKKSNPNFVIAVFLSFGIVHGGDPHDWHSISPATSQLHNWAANSSLYSHPSQATNLHGNPIPNLTASQTIGARGHILLQDHFLIEKLAHFTRERIPERVVHAKGTGAHGVFEVTHDVSHLTKANWLNKIGRKTPAFVRFSTTLHGLGSPDTEVDMHGFAVKLYTPEGNHDLLSLSTEVLGVRDPMLFPDLQRSRKRNPVTNMVDWNSFWDFVSLRPETTMHTLLVFSDIGRPDGYRRMDAFPINTFQVVNSKGEVHFARFTWRTLQKKRALTVQRSLELAGENPDYKTQDLYDAIERGDYPRWELSMQVMSPEVAKKLRWNPFDTTRLWRREQFPLIPIGVLTLNRNPENYFAEVEQAAFNPANMVPGIESSPDKLLHGRFFAYGDTQRYRLGVNHAHLPINRPMVPVNSYNRNGQACFGNNGGGSPNYFPNSFGGAYEAKEESSVRFSVEGMVDRWYVIPQDEFELSRLFVDKDLNPEERQKLCDSIADRLKEASPTIRGRVLKNNFYPVSQSFGDQMRHALEVAVANAERRKRRHEF